MKIDDYDYYWLSGLDAESSCEYEDLTHPSITRHWQATQQYGELLGIAASLGDEIVGLAIVELDTQSGKAGILSLFVEPEHRGQGIGTHLIQQLETKLIEMGCKRVQLSYQATEIAQVALEPILQRQGWKLPKVSLILVKAEAERIPKIPWVKKYQLPKDLVIFSWQELTEEEKQQLQQGQEEKPWYQQGLSPFLDETIVEPINSLGLRYQGEVVGWMVTHRVAPDTIRYTSMFVEKRWQRLGRGIVLMAESLQRQYDRAIPYYAYAVSSRNPLMLEFVDRHCQPYMSWIAESKTTYKRLVE
ncbi:MULTISPECIES: GNAT family N-acetyltransferase [unclassified Microcoleus]|uniref:GNAT family N-acetyltransferase n=1 Tax=unclassified Microcoleus TaxID=2642155 RepID=UPI002FD15BA4